MKHTLILLLLLCCVHGAYAQSYTIKGIVADTLNYKMLYRSSAVLLGARDSVIKTFGRTGTNGGFELKVDSPGRYILRISYPAFGDYTDVITVDKPVTDVGTVAMTSKEKLLQEFVLTKQYAAIKIKGDTTEYVADSFKTKQGANVEDLLKRLPGLQVDKNGQITAQGEKVQKILVDGEEFFSDDPKVVTKGLQANAIDKVQVFDKKSDQAEFTGIDDGQKTKTINLELKEDRKKGYFGKVDAGGGTDGYYQNQGMINAFKAKRQVAAFGIASNTDKIGLGWQDRGKFSSTGATEISDEEGNVLGTSYTYNSDDQDLGGGDGRYNGEGLPKTWTGGAHYADKWNEGKDHIAGNYRYAKQNVEIDGNTNTQYILPGNTGYVEHQHKDQFSTGERNALDVMYELKIDSSNTVKITTDAGRRTSQTLTTYNTNAYNSDNSLLNTNSRSVTGNGTSTYQNADLLYRHKFKKKGRTLSVDAKENYKDAKTDGFLNSLTTIYVPAAAAAPAHDSEHRIDQEKKNNTSTLAFSAKATYTEALSKKISLELTYGITANNSVSGNFSYNKAPTGDYSSLSDSFSSNYRYNYLTNSGGAFFRYNYKKFKLSAGSSVANTGYRQTDYLHSDTTRRYSYVNLYPRASITYKLSKQTSATLGYNGHTQQPTIDQIQPLRQNTDPTNITVGNPYLKQAFVNKLNVSFNDYKVITGRYLYIEGDYSFVHNDITAQDSIMNGINTIKYININGNRNGSVYAGSNFKLAKYDTYLGLNFDYNTAYVNNYINGQPNTSNNNSYSVSFSLNREKEKKYEVYFRPTVTYNDNRATVSTYAVSYWAGGGSVSASVQLPHKFEVGTDVNVELRQKTVVFPTNNNVTKWNAYIAKKLLKKGNLEVRASIYDILNQNLGYMRTAEATRITEQSYNTIRRYGMLNLVWNFTHTPGGAAPGGEGQ